MSPRGSPQSRSLVIDIYAPIIRPAGGWISIADLVTVLGVVDMEEQAVRSSVARLRGKGFLRRQVRDGAVGYALTDGALQILSEGDLHLYGNLEPASTEDGWVLIAFTVPEESRADRHQLRRRLTWLGFGSLGGGLWIAPGRVLQRTTDTLEREGLSHYVDVFSASYLGYDDLSRLVARCWDIDRMRRSYDEYCHTFDPVLRRWQGSAPVQPDEPALRDFVAVMHEWRQMPYLDPGLPPELLPEDWEGTAAATTFNHLNTLLLPAARAFVASLRTS